MLLKHELTDLSCKLVRKLLAHFVMPLLLGIVKGLRELVGKEVTPITNLISLFLCVLGHKTAREDSSQQLWAVLVLN